MEYYLSRVSINDLFEQENNYKIDLYEGCNCIYGSNGTGKTTIINLIVGALSADFEKLYKIPFSSINIYISKSGQKRIYKLLSITKNHSSEDNSTSIQIDLNNSDKFNLSIKSKSDQAKIREHSEHLRDGARKQIEKKINLTHVPLLRMHDADFISQRNEGDSFLHTLLINKNIPSAQINEIVDPSARVLSSLQKNFTNEANIARKNITQKLEHLKSKIIEKVMIDDSLVKMSEKATAKAFKAINQKENETVNIEAYIEKLKEAKINVPEYKIRDHFVIWQRQNENVRNAYDQLNSNRSKNASPDHQKKTIEITQDFNRSYFSLIAMANFNDRFLSIVKDVEDMQSEKQELTKVFSDYEDEVNQYFNERKKFTINEDGQFSITAKNRPVDPNDLSSGEKHVLTILGRAALSRKDGTVFVADEPELSLHLDWQRMILPSIIKLSPKSQIIVATHSPAIHAKNARSIDLEECR